MIASKWMSRVDVEVAGVAVGAASEGLHRRRDPPEVEEADAQGRHGPQPEIEGEPGEAGAGLDGAASEERVAGPLERLVAGLGEVLPGGAPEVVGVGGVRITEDRADPDVGQQIVEIAGAGADVALVRVEMRGEVEGADRHRHVAPDLAASRDELDAGGVAWPLVADPAGDQEVPARDPAGEARVVVATREFAVDAAPVAVEVQPDRPPRGVIVGPLGGREELRRPPPPAREVPADRRSGAADRQAPGEHRDLWARLAPAPPVVLDGHLGAGARGSRGRVDEEAEVRGCEAAIDRAGERDLQVIDGAELLAHRLDERAEVERPTAVAAAG
jgi:hypothetical protein